MPNKHSINIFDDLWPQRGEKLKYIGNDSFAAHEYDFETPTITCGNYYEVRDVSWIPCKDRVLIVDDTGLKWFWIDLVKFNYRDDV